MRVSFKKYHVLLVFGIYLFFYLVIIFLYTLYRAESISLKKIVNTRYESSYRSAVMYNTEREYSSAKKDSHWAEPFTFYIIKNNNSSELKVYLSDETLVENQKIKINTVYYNKNDPSFILSERSKNWLKDKTYFDLKLIVTTFYFKSLIKDNWFFFLIVGFVFTIIHFFNVSRLKDFKFSSKISKAINDYKKVVLKFKRKKVKYYEDVK